MKRLAFLGFFYRHANGADPSAGPTMRKVPRAS
jgi:hypothetical protein